MKTITCDHESIALTEESMQIETLKLTPEELSFFESLQARSDLSNLKELSITVGRFTENFIEMILSLTKLHTLHISCGRLMPVAFQKLYLISSLRELKLFCRLKTEIVDLEPLSLVVQLTSLTIRKISEDKLLFISSLVNLTSLELDCEVTDVLGFKLNALKKLKKLTLEGTEIGLECLSNFRDLEVLDLTGPLTEKTLVYILEMHNLTKLNLSGCGYSEDAYCFDGIDSHRYSGALFKNLVDLDLSGCTALLTGKFLSAIGENSQLKILKLKNCRDIVDGAFNSFKDLRNLVYADLTGCSLLENLSFLEQSKQLEELYLECSGVNDVAIQSLRELPALTVLNIAHCQNLSDEGMKYIGEIFSLKSLNCSFCNQISSEGIKYINHLVGLKFLGLSGCNVTADALIQLRLLRQLTILNLSCCRNLTKTRIKIIGTFPALATLYLNHCEQLSIRELRHLKNLRTLKKLWLDDCFDVPEDKLQKILPNVDIWI